MIQLHVERKSKIIVSEINSKELTKTKLSYSEKKINVHESPELKIYLEFPVPLMKRRKAAKYKKIERF